ncbi:hypothetical protein D3C80_1756420 [compost metagenome]
MKMDHVFAACALMQIIDILGHQHHFRHMLHQGRNGDMRRIRASLGDLGSAPFVPTPDQGRVVSKSGWRRELGWIERCPETGQLVPKRRDATFGRHSCAGEHHQPTRIGQPVHGVRERCLIHCHKAQSLF